MCINVSTLKYFWHLTRGSRPPRRRDGWLHFTTSQLPERNCDVSSSETSRTVCLSLSPIKSVGCEIAMETRECDCQVHRLTFISRLSHLVPAFSCSSSPVQVCVPPWLQNTPKPRSVRQERKLRNCIHQSCVPHCLLVCRV